MLGSTGKELRPAVPLANVRVSELKMAGLDGRVSGRTFTAVRQTESDSVFDKYLTARNEGDAEKGRRHQETPSRPIPRSGHGPEAEAETQVEVHEPHVEGPAIREYANTRSPAACAEKPSGLPSPPNAGAGLDR